MRFMPVIFISIAVVLWWLDMTSLISNLNQDNSQAGLYLLILSCLCYALLVMLPFVPGVELGYVIMMAFGLEGIIAVYISTAFSLSLGFLIGYFSRDHTVIAVLKNKLERQNNSLHNTNIYSNSAYKKGAQLITYILKRFRSQPYFAVFLLLNLPGNALIGGGGGIALMAGASGQLQPYKYLLTVLLATSIIPVLLIFGLGV